VSFTLSIIFLYKKSSFVYVFVGQQIQLNYKIIEIMQLEVKTNRTLFFADIVTHITTQNVTKHDRTTQTAKKISNTDPNKKENGVNSGIPSDSYNSCELSK
jgi:hypothetical protein